MCCFCFGKKRIGAVFSQRRNAVKKNIRYREQDAELTYQWKWARGAPRNGEKRTIHRDSEKKLVYPTACRRQE